MIPIAKDKLELVHKHAIEEYPHECCGIMIGSPDSDENDILFKCTNIQNKLHEMDPETYTRDARTAFNIESRELFKIQRETETRGLPYKLFYHSHPDHDAYFSEEDKRMALLDGEPSYPGANYLIVSVYDGMVKDQALFSWNPEKKNFEKQND